MGIICNTVVIVTALISCCCCLNILNNEHRVMEEIMQNYNKFGRPVANLDDKISCDMELVGQYVQKLDEKEGYLELMAWLRIGWTDEQLAWNATQYEDVSLVAIDIDKLWTPGLVIYNTRDSLSEMIHESIPAMVYPSGYVYYAPMLNIGVNCEVNLEEDVYLCRVMIGPWVYHGNQVNLGFLYGRSGLDWSSFKKHHEFELVKNTSSITVTYYDCCPNDPYQTVIFTLTFKKIPQETPEKEYDSIALYLTPTIVLGLFLPVIFIIPPEFTEKMVYGIGLLIANVLAQMLALDIIPAGHPDLELLEECHLVNIILNALALAIAALILKIWANGLRGMTLPSCVKALMKCCGCLLFVKHKDFINTYAPNPDMASKESRDTSETSISQSEIAHWKQLAVILDRIAFFIFLIIAIVVTVLLLTRTVTL